MAESEDGAEKSEDPTGKKLSDARSEGQVPMSRELPTWATLTMTLVVMVSLAPEMAAMMRDGLVAMLAQAAEKPMDSGNVGKILAEVSFLMVKVVAIPMALLAGVGIAATVLQTGGLVS